MTVASRSLPLHRPRSKPEVMALFSKGFRPFFLLAAAFAALAVPVWLLALRGGVQPGGSFGAMQWHAHEMLFGFSVAVIAGFLLTAVANWTERETVEGLPLFLLSALWLLGRGALLFAGSLPRLAPALIDLAFLPALAVVCARPMVASRNRRNYPFLVLLLLLALTNAAAHFGALRQDLLWVRGAHRVALDIVLLMVLIVSGRVIPMFTRNATQSPGLRSLPLFERGAAIGLALLLLADALGLPERASAPLAAFAAAFSLLRMRHWGTLRSFREPLLWVLHGGALWLPIGLLLRAASSHWSLVPQASALHALTAGTVGTLTLGMMARVSLGHTGRALRAPRPVAGAFGLIVAAALLRVAGPFLPPNWYFTTLVASGTLWSSSFAAFFLAYAKILASRRADAERAPINSN